MKFTLVQLMGMFGRTKKDPKEVVRELRKKLRHESNQLKRNINRIQLEEDKVS
jgi:hypothetical protein